LKKIYTRTGIDNIGSKGFAIKNKFNQEGFLRNEFRLDNGKLIDLVYFGKLKHESESWVSQLHRQNLPTAS